MLIDYLRYVAFNGRLRSFFEDGLYKFVPPSETTGQHLRFSPDYLDSQLGSYRQQIIHELYWSPHSYDPHLERLKNELGISSRENGINAQDFINGGRPVTFSYSEHRQLELEIIIDIDPEYWTERYNENASYEGVPILFRRAGPAKAHLSSGDKLLDGSRPKTAYGTLCGFFCTEDGPDYALTCGHVASAGARVLVERHQPIWKRLFRPRLTNLGQAEHYAMCNPVAGPGSLGTHLDAALIAVKRSQRTLSQAKVIEQAVVKPISTILQEEPVRFRGSGRTTDQIGRILAVTVRKSIDLLKDGKLRDVGDVLLIGHRHPMYITQRVSRPGDSGAAVRQGVSSVGSFSELNQWHGMILGSDEAGAYATYSEHLWSWASQEIGNNNIDFMFSI